MIDEEIIAIVVLNWNNADLTIQFLENLREIEDSTNFITIVVDNGSEDMDRRKLIDFVNFSGSWIILDETAIKHHNDVQNMENVLLMCSSSFSWSPITGR